SADRENDLAEMLAALHAPVRVRGAIERVHVIDQRYDAALCDERHYGVAEPRDDRRLLVGRPWAQHRADELLTLDEQPAEIDLGLAAAQRADQRDPAADRERPLVRLEIGAADMIEDHVDASAVRRAPRRVGEIPLPVVDHRIRAERGDALELAAG